MGTLTGLPDPQGECVDKKGDVFFTTFASQEIIEYAHGGTSPINTLSNPGQYMEGCSVDTKDRRPRGGRLRAVGRRGRRQCGDLANASGSPTVLTDPNLHLGYQIRLRQQRQYFRGRRRQQQHFEFAELPKGAAASPRLR